MGKIVVVTGGGGRVAYSLLFRIAESGWFEPGEKISLRILESAAVFPGKPLKGLVMELEDCCFEHIDSITVGSDPDVIFYKADLVILIGASPRMQGMSRADLLKENGRIFAQHGASINRVADRNVVVFVVGNPCNTNCLIAMESAPDIPRSQFHAMSRLDQNRAAFQLARKASVGINDIDNMVIWGNHSHQQWPDIFNVTIGGRFAVDVLDLDWLKGEFVMIIRERGSEIINYMGKSSAGSAANAIVDGVKSILHPGKIFSSAVCSDANPYGILEGLIFSFPCRSTGSACVNIVDGFDITEVMEKQLKINEKELVEERDMVSMFLG